MVTILRIAQIKPKFKIMISNRLLVQFNFPMKIVKYTKSQSFESSFIEMMTSPYYYNVYYPVYSKPLSLFKSY